MNQPTLPKATVAENGDLRQNEIIVSFCVLPTTLFVGHKCRPTEPGQDITGSEAVATQAWLQCSTRCSRDCSSRYSGGESEILTRSTGSWHHLSDVAQGAMWTCFAMVESCSSQCRRSRHARWDTAATRERRFIAPKQQPDNCGIDRGDDELLHDLGANCE